MILLGWIILVLGILGIVFIAKLSHLKHKLSISFVVGFILLLVLSFLKVASTNGIELSGLPGFFSAVQVYFFWMGHVFDNLRVITGNVVRMDWFSVN